MSISIMGAVLSVVITVLSGLILHTNKDGQRKAAQRENDRVEREELTLEALNADFTVNKELVACVLEKKEANGDLEDAFKYQQTVKHKLESYLRKRAAQS